MWLLKEAPDEPARAPAIRPEVERTDASGWFVCVECRHRITPASARIEVNGQHRHVCVNPSGLAFDIACFATAPGAIPHGSLEAYWSWFEGYLWRVALCGGCGRHLGWSFEGSAGTFHGLVALRLALENPEKAEDDEG